MNPHHRPSRADGVAPPVPGLLVGGPNPGQEDHVPNYPSNLPARSYLDNVDSYASNEIAINWNAPLVYLAIGIEALRYPSGPSTEVHEYQVKDLPREFGILSNYPNPFNPSTKIRFVLPFHAWVSLVVYSELGSAVATIIEGEFGPGVYEPEWNADGMASCVYFCRLTALPTLQGSDGRHTATTKMLLMR